MRQTLKQTPSAAGSCDWRRLLYAALVNDALVDSVIHVPLQNNTSCCLWGKKKKKNHLKDGKLQEVFHLLHFGFSLTEAEN